MCAWSASALGKRARGWVQFASLLIQNANFRGFFTGQISQGPLKRVCVPGLNCYSCPGAVGACPIGSLQSFLASRPVRLPYYVVGLLLFFGTLLGRAVCGFLCPFGFIQELLHRIPVPGKLRGFPGDRLLRRLKYAVLLVFVLLLPLVWAGTPAFCKLLCPAGTLEGGVPLVLLNLGGMRFELGALFFWKLALLLAILLLCLWIERPFCKYLCPLGAIYGLMNRVSLLRLRRDPVRCTGCGLCAQTCPMQVDPVTAPDSAECIRCGRCAHACPTSALRLGFRAEAKNQPTDPQARRA